MRRIVDFVITLDIDDQIRHHHIAERGRVIEFVVQYETWFERRWHAVVRYDTTHGFAHRDLLYPDGRKEKTPLGMADFDDALTYAEHDLDAHWPFYKRRYLTERKPG